MSIWARIKGGWKTWGPNAAAGDAGFASSDAPSDVNVNPETAMRLSAVWACMHLRAETIGSLPIHVRDGDKKVVKDHPLYAVLHDSPNAMQTAPEYISMQTAHVDMYGDGLSTVERRSNGSVISLEPFAYPPEIALKQGTRGWYYETPDGEKFDAKNVLHQKGFSMDGRRGLSRLHVGRAILAAQISADKAAMTAFQNGMKVGGFFKQPVNQQGMTPAQAIEFKNRLDTYARAENAGKGMLLPPGVEPVGGENFRMRPADAELLSSRYMGIEEICRLFNVPPQLIGHTDKASSWASSIEQINLFFLMYSLQPTLIRDERRFTKTLLTTADRARGLEVKFSLGGLMRADAQTRSAFYASGLQNGWLNRNEVRDLEDRVAIDNGDEYTVQLNMGQLGAGDKPAAKPPVAR
jgi:HK97 family phage portal protein